MAAKTGTGIFKALLASSRPLQSTLSIAQPLFAAFLAVGGFPDPLTLALLIIGSAAGLYCVFSLNDLLDYELDRKTVKTGAKRGWDIDSLFARHPVTAGLITIKQQIAWIVATALIAIAILYYLNPFALLLFALAALLEWIYCRLAMVTHYKFVVAGSVVSVGALIGWFAAGGAIEPVELALISALFFAWEIGGRNIPNDFSDIAQDTILGVKTLARQQGEVRSSKLVMAFGVSTLAANALLALHASLGIFYLVISTAVGAYFLLIPAVSLMKKPKAGEALKYFNKASLYPVALLICLALSYALKNP